MAKEIKVVSGRGKRSCPKCSMVCSVRQAVCPKCGFQFPRKDKTASTAKPKSMDLKSALENELATITETLANKSQMEQRAKLIEQLLKTM